MAHSRLYRSFLILQEAEKGYSTASDKPISAYTKIEGKNDSCRISFYAQNLKKDNYYMLLICSKKGVNKNITLSPLNINEQGRAEVSADYDINNIAGTGIPMNSISGAAIVILSDDRIKVIMKGYMDGEKVPNEWREYPLVQVFKDKEELKEVIVPSNETVPVASENLSEEQRSSDPQITAAEDEIVKEVKVEEKNVPLELSRTPVVQEEGEEASLKATDKKEDRSIDNEISEDTSTSSRAEEIVNSEESEPILEESAPKEESVQGLERKVNIIGSRNNNDITIEEIQALKEFIKAQELRLGLIERIEEDKVIDENQAENKAESKETKEVRSIVIDQVSPELREDLKDLNSIDTREFTRALEENEFDRYEKSIEEDKNKLIERYHNEIEDSFVLRGSVGEFFLDMAKEFEPISFRNSDIKYCKWFKVPVDNIDDLCDISNYNKYTIAYYPMMNYYPYIKNHKHFILGLKGDGKGSMKYLVYGIPGGKGKQEQPYGGKSGFVTWIPCDKDEEKGYWLMFYDFKNSVIVVPIRQED